MKYCKRFDKCFTLLKDQRKFSQLFKHFTHSTFYLISHIHDVHRIHIQHSVVCFLLQSSYKIYVVKIIYWFKITRFTSKEDMSIKFEKSWESYRNDFTNMFQRLKLSFHFTFLLHHVHQLFNLNYQKRGDFTLWIFIISFCVCLSEKLRVK